MPQYQNATLNVASMPTGFSALLVYDQDEQMGGVERIFLAHGVKLRRSRNCLERGQFSVPPLPPASSLRISSCPTATGPIFFAPRAKDPLRLQSSWFRASSTLGSISTSSTVVRTTL
jgi:hypothetical protein